MKMNKILRVLLSAVLLTALICTVALASSSINEKKKADLTIDYVHKKVPVADAEFDLYLVSTVSAFFEHELDGDFTGFRAELTGLDTEDWDTLASTLAAYAELEGFTPEDTGTTDEDGTLVFEDLTPGLYLAVGKSTVQDEVKYTVKPFLVFLPGRESADGKWIYDVTIKPKSESEEETEEPVARKVTKVWNDAGYSGQRPKEITVYLLRDGMVEDVVNLNDDNAWSYSWKELDGDSNWTIMEGKTDYYATVNRVGITYVVTNTPGVLSDDDDEDSIIEIPNDPTPLSPFDKESEEESIIQISDDPTPLGTLPQTGLLWWPVMVLVPAGLLLLSIGLFLRKRERNE